MTKEQSIASIQTELINIQLGLAKGITKTNNSKLRTGYLNIYNKIKVLLKELSKSMLEPNSLLIDLKNQTLEIDPNADGFSLHCSFNIESTSLNFVQFKTTLSHEE
jgi:hypothetical protein